MTNFEKYKERILEIVDTKDTGIAVCNGVLHPCGDVSCDNCDFCRVGNHDCDVRFIRWLYQEYQEKPKLSEKAYHLLKSFPDDAEIIITNGFLYVVTGGVMDSMDYLNFLPEFPDEVKNGKQYKVSDLLKWEVVNDETT